MNAFAETLQQITDISEPLTRLFNLSLSQGIMPNLLKISKITPVDKGGEITDPTNIRPISTLSAFTQIFDKLVYKQLISYFENSTFFLNINLDFVREDPPLKP